MTHYSQTTVIVACPDNFRLNTVETQIMEIMNFTIFDQGDQVELAATEYNDSLTLTGIKDADISAQDKAAIKTLFALVLDLDAKHLTHTNEITYIDLFKHILKTRYPEGAYIQTTTALFCDKTRKDGFGGYAAHITGTSIEEICTESFLRERR